MPLFLPPNSAQLFGDRANCRKKYAERRCALEGLSALANTRQIKAVQR